MKLGLATLRSGPLPERSRQAPQSLLACPQILWIVGEFPKFALGGFELQSARLHSRRGLFERHVVGPILLLALLQFLKQYKRPSVSKLTFSESLGSIKTAGVGKRSEAMREIGEPLMKGDSEAHVLAPPGHSVSYDFVSGQLKPRGQRRKETASTTRLHESIRRAGAPQR